MSERLKKKILITGGTGFQGSNLAKTLLTEGYDITILNTPGEKNDTNIKRFGLQDARIVWGSITSKDIVSKVMVDVDLVVHAAAKVHVDDSIKHPTEYFETNVMGTNNILQSARDLDIPVMHISTCEVYGFIDSELYEDSPLMPRSPYAASKVSADRMAYSYYITYNMNVCIIRPFNVFGPGQKDGDFGAVIPRWCTSLMKGEDIKIYGDGSQAREFIYIDDLISAYQIIINKMLAGNELAGEVINIGTGIGINIKKLAEEMCYKIHGPWIEPENHDFSYPTEKGRFEQGKIIYGDPRPGEVRRFISNFDKMKSFGWNPKIKLSDGLNEYIKWRNSLLY
jgi:dTDP-glucose 4,6-dehydratase